MPLAEIASFGFGPASLPFLAVGASLGYFLVLFTNPVRSSLRDGLRAVRRYPTLWLVFGAFGFAYTLFQLIERVLRASLLEPGDRPAFVWLREAWRDPQNWLTGTPESFWYLPAHGLPDAASAAVLPALENLAGLFNNLVITFPLAIFAAVLLLVNWQGHHMVLLRALRRRYGRWGWVAYAGILLGALAVLAKPVLYAAPPLLKLDGEAALAWFQWAPVIVWLAFLFEYLFGICIQIYLILLAYCWVRGLTFQHANLLDFAIRRFAFVVKWALVVLVLSSLFIDLPLILKNFEPFQRWFPDDPDLIGARVRLARGLLTGFLLIFATMQATLTFHSESLVDAVQDHLRFVVRNGWPLAWFLVMALVHFYLFQMFHLLVSRGLGEGTAPGIVWSLLSPWLGGAIGAWLLASWVCLYRRCENGRSAVARDVQF